MHAEPTVSGNIFRKFQRGSCQQVSKERPDRVHRCHHSCHTSPFTGILTDINSILFGSRKFGEHVLHHGRGIIITFIGIFSLRRF